MTLRNVGSGNVHGNVWNICQDSVPALRRCLFSAAIASFFFLTLSSHSAAQSIWSLPEDSLQVERLIQLYGPGDLISNARRALVARLRNADSAAVSSLLHFMPNRQGGGGWLWPEEELIVRTLIVDLPFFRDQDRLASLLIARVSRPGEKPTYEDNLLNTLRGLLRTDPSSLVRSVEEKGGTEAESRFFQVLVNVQQVTGIRKVAEANRLIDWLVREFPDSWYAGMADRYLRLGRFPARIGGGFFLGYAYGGGVGSGITGRSDGPTIGGELYWKEWTVAGELMLGRLEVSDSFAVRGRTWQAGDAVLLGGTLGIGYEFRTGDGLVTPFAGGSFFTLQEEVSPEVINEEHSSGLQPGLALGTLVTYRIPFDHGPHLDLRLRAMAIFPGFSRYSSELGGGMLLVGASFGFVGRPYRVGPIEKGGTSEDGTLR